MVVFPKINHRSYSNGESIDEESDHSERGGSD